MGTLQFIGWLKHHLDRRTFEGCVWVNREQQIFKILWPRADKNLTPEKLGVMFKWWTHKFGNTRNHNQPTAIKGNFRYVFWDSAQNLAVTYSLLIELFHSDYCSL